ncbi:MAG: hypothetical protein AB8V03_04100 [Francisella endosymbiont of Hyalomma asiaticum]
MLFLRVLSVLAAINYRCGYIYKSISYNKSFIVSIISGILMGFFYPLITKSISSDFMARQTDFMTPYIASFIFALWIFISNFIINGWMIKFTIYYFSQKT